METYIPGACNIGKHEITKRKVTALGGLILSILYSLILMNFPDRNILLTLGVAFPLYMMFVGFFQSYFKFCVKFGVLGIRNINGETENIENEFLRKDKMKAMQIIVLSVISTVLTTLLLILVI